MVEFKYANVEREMEVYGYDAPPIAAYAGLKLTLGGVEDPRRLK